MQEGKVVIYTDGGCIGNPGQGGYGIILEFANGKQTISKEISQGYALTTNNRMELMAVIRGLEELKKERLSVVIYSDSKYVVDAVNKKWLFTWDSKNFMLKGKPRINADLWKRFIKCYRLHKVKLIWVKGHNQNPFNERCDYLVSLAIKRGNLLRDAGYV